jgi:outer membrane usher protein
MARPRASRLRFLSRASEAFAAALLVLAQPALAHGGGVGEGTGERTAAAAPERGAVRMAAAFDPAASVRPAGTPLMLEVTVNGMGRGIAPFRLIDNRLWAAPEVLGELGLRLGASDNAALIALDQEFASAVSYDPGLQTVTFMVETSRLAVGTTRLNFNDQSAPVAASATGLVINYDVNANYAGGRLGVAGFTETRLFSGNALLENTALFQAGNQGFGTGRGALRLDTTASFSVPDKRLTIRAGDLITRQVSFSRPTRLGGIRVGTDFALQPYFVPNPVPAFFGDAALPSTVDLFIDGLRRFSGQVAPGPFEIGTGANRVNGAGQAQVVVTDALGQVSSIDFPLYDTPLLLRKGLADWSVEVGAVRRNYGIRSFDYGKAPVASATLRYGISDNLTLEAHGEGGDSLANGGAGLAWLIPNGGVVAGSVAASSDRNGSGVRYEFGYSFLTAKFNLSATMQRASGGFRDLAALQGGEIPRARDIVSVGYNSDRFGSFGASLIRQKQQSRSETAFVALNWSQTIARRLAVNLSAQQSLTDRRERGVFLTLSLFAGKRDQFSAGVQANEQRVTGSFGYRRTLPFDGGLGWALDGVVGQGTRQVAGQIDKLGPVGQATLGGRVINGQASAFAGYSGALVVMDGSVFASRKVFDGFALVSTGDVAAVPVSINNRPVGKTNRKGKLLVIGLNAFEQNRIGIDAADLPATLEVASTEQPAVPATRAGVRVKFAIAPVRSVIVDVVDAKGVPLPLGTAAMMEGDEEQALMVGHAGQLFIERARPGARVTLARAGQICTFRLPDELPAQLAGRLGKVQCERLYDELVRAE